jgi:serine/threonine protein phosphatase PrpC
MAEDPEKALVSAQWLVAEWTPLSIAGVTRPLPGYDDCGDAIRYWQHGEDVYLCIVDGLGHGERAADASRETLDCLQRRFGALEIQNFEYCDKTLRHTVGVAVGLARIAPQSALLYFCGIGNIRALVRHEGRQSQFNCSYGILGAGFHPLFIEKKPFPPGATLIMATDGIDEHFDQYIFAPTESSNPQRMGEVILNRYGLQRDDAGLVICRHEETPTVTR